MKKGGKVGSESDVELLLTEIMNPIMVLSDFACMLVYVPFSPSFSSYAGIRSIYRISMYFSTFTAVCWPND
jgi:hypothetical protein